MTSSGPRTPRRNSHEAADAAEFDQFRETYETELNQAVAFIGQDADVYTAAKASVLVDVATRWFGDPTVVDVLDVGCGTGTTDSHLLGRLGSISGADVSEGMIERARSANPSVDYRHYDGRRLPYPDGEFDIAFAICVLHHVPPAEWAPFVLEMKRVTKHGGLVAIFEHNPLNPLTRLAVNRCSFDEDAHLLTQWRSKRLLTKAGLKNVSARNILFSPWRSRSIEAVERRVGRIPLGAQYVALGRRA
jgi:SAM-dependent methyltransferase